MTRTSIKELEKMLDEAYQEVAFTDMNGEWEMCRLSVKCDYDNDDELLLPSIFTYGLYVDSEFIEDSGFTHFRVIDIPSPPVGGVGRDKEILRVDYWKRHLPS